VLDYLERDSSRPTGYLRTPFSTVSYPGCTVEVSRSALKQCLPLPEATYKSRTADYRNMGRTDGETTLSRDALDTVRNTLEAHDVRLGLVFGRQHATATRPAISTSPSSSKRIVRARRAMPRHISRYTPLSETGSTRRSTSSTFTRCQTGSLPSHSHKVSSSSGRPSVVTNSPIALPVNARRFPTHVNGSRLPFHAWRRTTPEPPKWPTTRYNRPE
jgi:hypothetical protein